MTLSEIDTRFRTVGTKKIARIIGVHPNMVLNYRSGRCQPRFSVGLHLCRILAIQPEELDEYLTKMKSSTNEK